MEIIMKKILLNTAVLFLLFTVLSSSLWGEEGKRTIENLSSEDFAEKISSMDNPESFAIIDVRTPEEFYAGRIKGSVNFNYYDSFFLSEIKKLDRDKTYFIYCRSGNRSGQTLREMDSLGFKRVYNLGRGIVSDSGHLDIVK